eukprot:TRINITY_DN34681_c0_g1_i3.p1 TRINITY_DN34681_c0_g1~~TRINITY_DN34681_c0_g1_i3.p1  ORF type:complete len:471 (+),score=102.29 TRINITY_DN34681_c0_g1_i3:105-1517(+)
MRGVAAVGRLQAGWGGLRERDAAWLCAVCGAMLLPSLWHGKALGDSAGDYDTQQLASYHARSAPGDGGDAPQCASWVPPQQREVVFVDFHGAGGNGTTGGETFVAHALSEALAHNGFRSTWLTTRQLQRKDLRSAWRVVGNGEWFLRSDGRGGPARVPVLSGRLQLCRLFAVHFWGRARVTGNFAGQRTSPRQFLSPYRDACDVNTFIGFHVRPPQPSLPPERGRVGLVWGKRGKYLSPHKRLLQALVDDGWEVHVTCHRQGMLIENGHRIREYCDLPEGVHNHRNWPPRQWRQLLGNAAFLLGVGDPVLGPSALEALAHGTTVLLPPAKGAGPPAPERTVTFGGMAAGAGGLAAPCEALPPLPAPGKRSPPTKQATQHDAVARLGPPYVHLIDLEDTQGVLAAARRALRERFVSYVPPDYRCEKALPFSSAPPAAPEVPPLGRSSGMPRQSGKAQARVLKGRPALARAG